MAALDVGAHDVRVGIDRRIEYLRIRLDVRPGHLHRDERERVEAIATVD